MPPEPTGPDVSSGAQPARMYDFYLDGKDHFPVDADAARRVLAQFPAVKTVAQTNRAFMRRATRAVAQAGVRQFVDIGTGIPHHPNLHNVAQAVDPTARVLYVDNDPIVVAHAHALLRGTAEGRTAYLEADVRDPESILSSSVFRETIDLNEPVAISLCALLHFVPDEYGPYEIVSTLIAPLPAESHLILSHCTPDFDPVTWGKVIDTYRAQGIPAQVRTRHEVAAFFDGLEVIDPGVVLPTRWRPDTGDVAALLDKDVSLYAGVGRKP